MTMPDEERAITIVGLIVGGLALLIFVAVIATSLLYQLQEWPLREQGYGHPKQASDQHSPI